MPGVLEKVLITLRWLNEGIGEMPVCREECISKRPGGVRFDGSVQTPLVRAETFQQLMLESPTRRLVVQGPQGVLVESRAGDIGISCHRNLTLKSKEGEVQLDSDRIVFPNLRTALPASSGSPYQNVYQVCVCQSGTLFLSRAEGQCQADEYVCK
ncbi:delta-sarcoglycan [Ixodes scapularis]